MKRWGDEAPPAGVDLVINDPALPGGNYYIKADQLWWLYWFNAGSDTQIKSQRDDLLWDTKVWSKEVYIVDSERKRWLMDVEAMAQAMFEALHSWEGRIGRLWDSHPDGDSGPELGRDAFRHMAAAAAALSEAGKELEEALPVDPAAETEAQSAAEPVKDEPPPAPEA